MTDRKNAAMTYFVRCLHLLLILLAATAAHAESFNVSVRVFCPSAWDENIDQLDVTVVTNRPCAGIRVTVLDADPLWDEYCGSAYTNSQGVAMISGECGDTAGGRPEVYLKVEGRSVNGFSVGIIEPFDPLDRFFDSLLRSITGGFPLPLQEANKLRSHQTLSWISAPKLASDNQTLAFGDVAIGGGGAVSLIAARHFRVANYTTLRLMAGTRYRPMDFNYTIAAPFGEPTTLYDTILSSFTNNTGMEANKALRDVPHEIGHVLYNTYHSGIEHWLLDGPDYMTHHRSCDTNHFQTLAWYEGFADFVRDYVVQKWNWSTASWSRGTTPGFGCAVNAVGVVVPGMQDMHIEGNVQALLNNIFFGPVRLPLGRARPADFTCPSGQTRVESAEGVVECEREVPTTCELGSPRVDHQGVVDECLEFVRDRACPPRASCEPVQQWVASRCSSGRGVRRTGADACIVRSPGRHDLPNGTPRPRPDGSPDLVIGASSDGGRAWFALPDLDRVIEWVIQAAPATLLDRTGGHRASEYWQDWIRPWCLARERTQFNYCNPDRSPGFLSELRILDPALR